MDIFTQPPAIALYVSLAINVSMFLIAFWRQSDKLTDVSYAVTFAIIALWGFINSEQTWFHMLLATLVLTWSLRLSAFLLYRVIKVGKDARFDDMRGKFWTFGRFWLAQAITVWVVMIPSIFAFESNSTFGWLHVCAASIWLVGLACESLADVQKFSFSQNPNNKNQWIESGIWRLSRHPNYFGEILVWIGLYGFVFASLSPLQAVIGLVSPLFIICLLLFISGIPILEKSADVRWGNNPKYTEYKRRTSLLIPLPPKKL